MKDIATRGIQLIAEGYSLISAANMLGVDKEELRKAIKVSRTDATGAPQPTNNCQRKQIKEGVKNSPLLDTEWYKRQFDVIYDAPDMLELTTLPQRILAFSCTQFPFEKEGWEDFLKKTLDLVQPELIVMHGDLVDFKFFKKEFMHPDDASPTQELEQAAECVNKLAKIVPKAVQLTSNHAEGRLRTAQMRGNMPSAFLRRWQDVVGLPETWVTRQYLIADDWLFEHGDGISKGSKSSHRQDMIKRFGRPLSVMRGHRHGEFGPITQPIVEAEGEVLRVVYVGCIMEEKKVTYTNSGLWNGCIALMHGLPISIHMLRDFRTRKWTGNIHERTQSLLKALIKGE